MYKKLLYTVILGMVCIHSLAQSKWKGDAGDRRWRSPLNWTDGIAPGISPAVDVLLDNSLYQENYTIKIETDDSIVIRSLAIAPDPGKTITLIIDTSAYKSIALTTVSAAGIISIFNGGKLINGSKAASGEVIKIGDSLRLNNGAIYSHQTRRTHNELVNRLSKRPGTELGVFEFNIPTASSTLSLSNRTYGSLQLSSTIYGKPCTYSGTGTNPLHIRGDLLIDTSVSFSLGMGTIITVDRDFIQKGGLFNIANSSATSVICFKGNIEQDGGQISKTGSSIPTLMFNGTTSQNLRLHSAISPNIRVAINNAAGVVLQKPFAIPYRLELIKGPLTTTAANLLTLMPNSLIISDSTSNLSYVDGPMKVEGLIAKDHYLFPVGKNGLQRWLGLKEVTGGFKVEYFRDDPHGLSSQMDQNLHHVSRMEYWSVEADNAATAKIALSFNQNSGNITDLPTLRVGKWKTSGSWQDIGNTGTIGTPELGGVINSRVVTDFSQTHYFTLASSSLGYNVLPVNENVYQPFYRQETRSRYGIRSVAVSPNSLQCLVYADLVRSVLFEVLSFNGITVFRSNQYLLKGKNNIHLTNFNAPSGVYILRVMDRTQSSQPAFYGTHRFLVVR